MAAFKRSHQVVIRFQVGIIFNVTKFIQHLDSFLPRSNLRKNIQARISAKVCNECSQHLF